MFPLSDRPTKIAATQKILLLRLIMLMQNYFFYTFFFSFVLYPRVSIIRQSFNMWPV
jgi:hypothetical protein